MQKEHELLRQIQYPRNTDLDPQSVWRGKDEQDWSNRMILGEPLQVMVSLAEREGLRGKVQRIYFDPPYGVLTHPSQMSFNQP